MQTELIILIVYVIGLMFTLLSIYVRALNPPLYRLAGLILQNAAFGAVFWLVEPDRMRGMGTIMCAGSVIVISLMAFAMSAPAKHTTDNNPTT